MAQSVITEQSGNQHANGFTII